MQAIKKEQEFGRRSFWDVLKHGARIVLFSDLVEVKTSSVSSFFVSADSIRTQYILFPVTFSLSYKNVATQIKIPVQLYAVF